MAHHWDIWPEGIEWFIKGESSAQPWYAEMISIPNTQGNAIIVTSRDGKTKTTLFEFSEARGRKFAKSGILERELELLTPAQE